MSYPKTLQICLFFLPILFSFCSLGAQEVEIQASGQIKNVKDPVDPQDAATKAYVDAIKAAFNEDLLDAGLNGFVEDIDGNKYKTIKIGEQVWMAENLKATHYNDGTPIPKVTDNTKWMNLSTSGYCWYANDSTMNAKVFGALYNYYAVVDTKSLNVCPVGWDVPTNDEWTVLTEFLEDSGYGHGGSGSDIGKSMAATFRWSSSLIVGQVGNDLGSNNSSGFAGLPGGARNTNGSFTGIDAIGYWWSSTDSSGSNALYLLLSSNDAGAFRSAEDKRWGFSVRCVRD